MYSSNEKFYRIKIVQKKDGLVLWHIGGNILRNTPTTDVRYGKVYYSLSGANYALKKVESHLGDGFEVSVITFHPVFGV